MKRGRDYFKIPSVKAPKRGRSGTSTAWEALLPNCPTGRHMVCIAGEHEDYYDPDFYIYNDVIVFTPAGDIGIYGYPKDVFPPTDFYTATLDGDRIIIVGCCGYCDARRPAHTPVYALDLSDYHVSEMKTSGRMPGWIWDHEAGFNPRGIIAVRGGKIFEECGDKPRSRRNIEEYAAGLDIRSGMWRQSPTGTGPNSRFAGVTEEVSTKGRSLRFCCRAASSVRPCPEAKSKRKSTATVIVVEEMSVSLSVDFDEIRMVVQGELPGELLQRLTEDMRTVAEAAIQQPCVLERV